MLNEKTEQRINLKFKMKIEKYTTENFDINRNNIMSQATSA